MKLRKETLIYILLFVSVSNVFFKSMDIPYLVNIGNSLEVIAIILASAFIILNKYKIPKPFIALTLLFSGYIFISLVSSVEGSYNLVIIQLITNLKFFLLIIFFTGVNCTNVIYNKVSRFIFCFLLLNFLAILVELLLPSIYSSIFRGAITDTVIQGTEFKRYTGLFYHPGPMGIFCCIAFLMSLFSYKLTRNKMYLYSLMFSMIGAISSGQRMEMAATLLIILLVILGVKYKRLLNSIVKRYSKIIVFLPLITSLYFILGLRYDTNFTNFDNARGVLYIGAIHLAKNDFPLGEGLAKYGSSTSIDNKNSSYYKVGINNLWWFEGASYLTDTFWAMVIGESGWIGFSLYILFLTHLLLILTRKSTNNGRSSYVSIYALSLLFYSVIISLNSPVYTGTSLPLFFIGINVGQSMREI